MHPGGASARRRWTRACAAATVVRRGRWRGPADATRGSRGPRDCCARPSWRRSPGSRAHAARSRSRGWATCCAPPRHAPDRGPVAEPSPPRASRRATSTAARSIPTACGSSSPGRRTCCSRRTAAPPATAVTTLTDALAPSVRISCHWRTDGGRTIVSTLAGVAGDAGLIADAALRGQGFACAAEPRRAACARAPAGDVLEEHTIRGGLWLSSVGDARGIPDGYGARLVGARVGLSSASVRETARRSRRCSRSARGSRSVVSIRMSSRQNSVRPSVTGSGSLNHVFSQRVPPSGV